MSLCRSWDHLSWFIYSENQERDLILDIRNSDQENHCDNKERAKASFKKMPQIDFLLGLKFNQL